MTPVAGAQSDEIDPRGKGVLSFIGAVPDKPVVARSQMTIIQGADWSALNVEDLQTDRSRVGDLEGERGRGVEWIREIGE